MTIVRSLKPLRLTEEIDRRWELKERLLESSIYIKAAALDPRFKKLYFFTDEQWDKAYSAVANIAESLAVRPLQEESVGSDLVEEREPTGPAKQKEKDQVMAMLQYSDEEEEQPHVESSKMKAYIKDYTKRKNRTTGMVAKE